MATIAYEKAPESLSLQDRATLLQDGVRALIVDDDFETRYFDRLPQIWGRDNPEFVLAANGLRGVINRDSIGIHAGQAHGIRSGIYPYADVYEPKLKRYVRVDLDVQEDGRPAFHIVPYLPE